MYSVQDKVIAVTGAASGLGAAITAELLEQGATVVASDIDADAVAQAHPRALATRCDVAVSEECRALVDFAVLRAGRLDGLVNNAGIPGNGDVVSCAEATWDAVMNVNLKGMFLTAKYAVPALRTAGGGSIVNIASVAGFWGEPGTAAYNAAKGGVIGLTRAMAMDHGAEGIRVNAVCPGYHRTGMPLSYFADQADPDLMQSRVAALIAAKRLGEPAELARTVAFLLSDATKYMQGAVLVADGGLTAGYPWHELDGL